MAKLKIYNSIEDKETKTIMEGWFGIESTCYEDIKDFIEQIPADDDIIDIYLHCPGGNCVEGWAMYDALRTSGKKITTVVDGLCASMGTVLMMAAPKERRLAQKNATICIHNPYCLDYFQYEEIAHADELDAMANKVRIRAEEMREMQEKIVNLYVERTGSSKEELQSLMNEDRCIGTDRALELGLIGSVLEPNTDKLTTIKNKIMTGEVTVKAGILDRMLAKLGLKSLDDMKCQVITDVTGTEITIDSDDEPAVGDTASPDGEYTLEDGSVMVISGGEIKSIDKTEEAPIDKKPEEELEEEEEEEEKEEKEDEDEEDKTTSELEAKIEDLMTYNAALSEEIAELKNAKAQLTSENFNLKTQNEAQTAQIESLKATAKTEEEQSILDKIAALGGWAWIEAAENVSSAQTMQGNQFKEAHRDQCEDADSIGAAFLAAKRAARHRM